VLLLEEQPGFRPKCTHRHSAMPAFGDHSPSAKATPPRTTLVMLRPGTDPTRRRLSISIVPIDGPNVPICICRGSPLPAVPLASFKTGGAARLDHSISGIETAKSRCGTLVNTESHQPASAIRPPFHVEWRENLDQLPQFPGTGNARRSARNLCTCRSSELS
jgi:hypothetical protein